MLQLVFQNLMGLKVDVHLVLHRPLDRPSVLP